MVRQSRSRAIMIALTLTATAALGTVARTAAQGHHPVATGGPCPLDPALTCVMTTSNS